MDAGTASGHGPAHTATARTAGEARAVVTAALAATVPPATVDSVRLVVSELVSNALQHGAAEAVEIMIVPTVDAVELVVAGGRATPEQLPRPADWAVAPPTAFAGRGLGIVAALADAIELATRDELLVVRCRVRR